VGEMHNTIQVLLHEIFHGDIRLGAIPRAPLYCIFGH
jgi:hypothetical protein